METLIAINQLAFVGAVTSLGFGAVLTVSYLVSRWRNNANHR